MPAVPAPPRFRRRSLKGRGALAGALVLCGAAGFASVGCKSSDLGMEPTQKEDTEARRKHHEESAMTYYDGGRYDQAAAQWRKVLEITPDDKRAKWGLAKALAQTGTVANLRVAESIFVQILDLDWNHPTRGNIKFELERDLAEIYVDLADYYDRDAHALEESLDKSRDPVVLGRMQSQIAKRNELLLKAMPLYERVLAQSPENPYALTGLAKANLIIGDPDRGVTYARRYIALSHDSQVLRQKQFEEFEKARGRDTTPEQREFLKGKIRTAKEKELGMRLLVASVLMRKKDAIGAVAEYDAILVMDPARPAAYVERAQAYALMGDHRRAMADLEKYLKVTDPVKHHGARIRAADLLDTYRVEANRKREVPTAPSEPRALGR
jgi:tetratricopeptide (TPR) repeat protein